jgi:hypothetical protein
LAKTQTATANKPTLRELKWEKEKLTQKLWAFVMLTVAVIGCIGVIVVALIGAWPDWAKLTPPPSDAPMALQPTANGFIRATCDWANDWEL